MTVIEKGAATVLDRLVAFGVVPVVELDSIEDAEPLLEALTTAGLPAAEITLRTAVGFEAIGALRGSHPDALIGAGTVRSLEDARRVIGAGAEFVVAPCTNPIVIEFCARAGVPVVPGACTPTEVDSAVRAGAALVKFFPAEAMGGVAFLKALAGPFRDVRFVPTGGINVENLADYLRVPQVAACGGSWMVAPPLVREQRFDEVEALARRALEIVAEVRSHD
jgi:2-dehydro-3-deoxyphosphogluconate aldolase/(4S)-4-hydroxy-2-oxoglutarate aldolase